MTTNSPSASERRDDVSDRSEQQPLARTVGAGLATRDWAWIAAAVAGGALLVRGLRTARERRGRGLLQVVAGGALLAVGYTRRGTAEERGGDRSGEASDDAHLEIERPDTEENPRDVTDDPAAEPSSEDEGDIQFSTDQTADLEGAADADADPELDDDTVEVDLSEAAVADEPGEAAGPTSAQAEPTTTKTDLSPPSDVEEPDVDDGLEHGSEGDGSGGSDEATEGGPVETADSGEGTVETEGGAEVHTDTMEAGTMDVDEADVTDADDEPSDGPGVEELPDDETADYQASEGDDGGEPTEETEGGTEVHTDTNEAGTMDVDEEDVDAADEAEDVDPRDVDEN